MRRREFLRLGLAGSGVLSLGGLNAARAAGKGSAATALIIVWLPGGASHLETYDPKPDASSEHRGPYAPIPTSASGVSICELLPRHAAVAHRFSILRSMVHTGFCHQQGTQQLLTGHPVRELRQKPDDPDFLAITHKVRFDAQREIPHYVGVGPINYSGSAYLGPGYEPFAVYGDPNSPSFSVPNLGLRDNQLLTKLDERIDLRKRLDNMRRTIDRSGNMQATDEFEGQAWSLISSSAVASAFDLAKEHPRIRDRYGRNAWGQQCLMARRLVEAGVDLVTVQLAGELCGRVGNWDDHAVNHNVFEGMKYRTPPFDQAVAALIEDIFERGLDRRVMVVVTGEFGRTPKISYAASTGKGAASAAEGTVQPGRDHWPSATSILFAGGGIEGGQIVGATDRRGEHAVERIVGVHDFLATMYRHLGVDAEKLAFPNFAGRPIPVLLGASPIKELVARKS